MMKGQKQKEHTMQGAPAEQHDTKVMMLPLRRICKENTDVCLELWDGWLVTHVHSCVWCKDIGRHVCWQVPLVRLHLLPDLDVAYPKSQYSSLLFGEHLYV